MTQDTVNIAAYRKDMLVRQAIELYFDFGNADKPTRRTIKEVAEIIGVSEPTMISWFSDVDRNLVESVTPTWVLAAATQEYVADRVPELLQRMVAIARGELPRTRVSDQFKAMTYLLSLAGIGPNTLAQQSEKESASTPITVSVNIGGVPAPTTVIDMTAQTVE